MRHNGMRTLLVVLLLCAASMTAGCSGANAPTTEVAASHATKVDGTLSGRLITVGGPAPGSPSPVAGAVTVTGGGVHLDVKVGLDGAYSVSLPAGRYTVVGHSPSVTAEGAAMPCPGRKEARVTPGATVVLDAVCSIK
jgi:hypothetical protein